MPVLKIFKIKQLPQAKAKLKEAPHRTITSLVKREVMDKDKLMLCLRQIIW